MSDNTEMCAECTDAAMQSETFETCDGGCQHEGCPWRALEKAETERDRYKNLVGGLCGYPLCDCGQGKECMVLDAPVPEVCDRKDLEQAVAERDGLLTALENMGALMFRVDLSQKEREEMCGDISRRAVAGEGSALADVVTAVRAERDAIRGEKDIAYMERNKVVAALARLFPSGLKKTDIPDWNPEWHGCVYIDLPTGQVSWHYHDSQAHLFDGLPAYEGEWDGHDTPEKYRRVAAIRALGD